MSCCKVGSGQYAGNAWNNPTLSASRLSNQEQDKEGIEVINGIPYAKTSVSVNNMIPILSAIGGVSQGLTNLKVQQAQAGTKTFSEPQTGAGRLIGRLTGRTQASEVQKSAQSTGPMSPAVSNVLGRQGIPVSGGIQFGKSEQNRDVKILGLVGVVVLGIFYFVTKGGRKRRRR